jgi:outer membrane protein, heavy metal efflux system
LARTELARTSAEVADEVAAMILQAQTHYWTAVAAEQNQNLRALSFEAASNSAALAQALHKAGNISAKQLASEAAEAALAAIEMQRAEGEFAGAKAALLLTLGLPADEQRVQLPVSMAPITSNVEPLKVLQARALTQRADLQAKRLGVIAFAQYLNTSKRWRWFSDLRVGAERERETDGEKLRGLNFSLSLPIFNQGQASVMRAGAWLTRAQAELALLEREVQSEVQLAHAGLLLQTRLLRTYQSELIPAREKLVEESQKQYNFMLIGAFDLILAKREEYQSYADAINAARDYWIQRAILKSAIGGELNDVPLSQSESSSGTSVIVKSAAQHQHEPTEISAQPKAFVCPMHPDVQSDQSGACPICKMALVPKNSTDAKSAETNQHEGHDHE